MNRRSYVDRRSLVQERDSLLPRRREIPGRQWRWCWRLRGPHAAARLPAGPRRDLRLASALLSISEPGQRLRCHRLLWREREARLAGRLRGVHAARPRPRHPRHRRPGRQPHIGRFAVVPAGASRSQVVLPRLVRLVRHSSPQSQRGHRFSGAADDDLDEGQAGEAGTTSIVSTTTRRTSTPGIPMFGPRFRKSWASGCSWACRDSAWMRCRS